MDDEVPHLGFNMARDNHQSRPSFSHYGSLGTNRSFPLVPRMSTPEPKMTTPSTRERELAVTVSVKFEHPVQIEYSRRYESSPDFHATDRICRGLLRRLEHCSRELITRKDSTAEIERNDTDGAPKQLRFTAIFQIDRNGAKRWSESTFKSYQRSPMAVDSAREVVLATDRMVGLFLRRHDSGFQWSDGVVREQLPMGRRTASPRISGPQPLCCVPRSRFNLATQQYEFVPGYEVELTFNSRCLTRPKQEWRRVLRINSQQSTPLNLTLAEDMLWKASKALNQAIDARKQLLDEQHHRCQSSRNIHGCDHILGDAVDVFFRIRNSLGPDFDHLIQRLRSRYVLFSDANGQDCKDFVQEMDGRLRQTIGEIDSIIDRLDDFSLSVHQLEGKGWRIDKPFTLSLHSSASYSQRSIEAILERVQTSVAGVLHGRGITITLSAQKRGHLVLDKTLVARASSNASVSVALADPQAEKEDVVSRIRDRIKDDIIAVCQDTCSLSDDPKDAVLQILSIVEDR